MFEQRKFPHPYRAMLAISTDIDRTTIPIMRHTHRFMNTRADTPAGPGLGLDVANSLWVFKPEASRDIALFTRSGDDISPARELEELAFYARSGWIDTLHSYGNFSVAGTPEFKRELARRAIDELVALGVKLTVWVNHGSRTNIQNVGSHDYMQGDLPASAGYHSDLMLDYGVRYIWTHTNTDQFGSDKALTPVTLRDGRRVWGFSRYLHEVGPAARELAERHELTGRRGVAGRAAAASERSAYPNWWPELFDPQVSSEKLDSLVERSQYAVIAQHLGDLLGPRMYSAETAGAFRRLRAYQDTGKLLVTRTSRLLEYSRVSEHLEYGIAVAPGQVAIDITAVRDPVAGTFVPTLDQVRGMTFYVKEPDNVELYLNGRAVSEDEIQRESSDGTSPSIGIRWFTEDTTDYSEIFVAANQRQRARAAG